MSLRSLATYSLKEVKHVSSANMRGLDSADNTIVCNDKPTFAMLVGFSIGDLALEGCIYHDTGLETRERFSFHQHIREAMDTIEKTKSKEKRPALTTQVRSICGEYYGYTRMTVKDGVSHRQETMPYPKGGTAWTVPC
ncbi:MAG: hypothetical protein QXU18_10950 [Thermoplasmatales archaeon]